MLRVLLAGCLSSLFGQAPSIPVTSTVEGLPAHREAKLQTAFDAGLARGGVDAALVESVQIELSVAFNGTDTSMHATASRADRVVADSRATCELCGDDEVDAMVGDLGARIGEKLSHLGDIGFIAVNGSPASAQLRLDGEPIAAAPLELEVEEGPHVIDVEAPGYEPARFEWTSVAGVRDHFQYNLTEIRTEEEVVADDAPADLGRGRKLKLAGWGLLGAGVAAAGTGATLWWLDGRAHQASCPSESVDANGLCPNSYTTGTAGIALTATGAAMVIASIPLLVVGHRTERRVKVGLSPRGAWVSGRF